IFSVQSQDKDHPFALTEYMPGPPGATVTETRPGCGPQPGYAGAICGLGDEDWVVLPPPEQFMKRYVFFTDPTYATTNLVVVREKGPAGFSDVNIECLGNVTGWQPVGTTGQYQYAQVDLVRGTTPVALCKTSRQAATSEGKFGITVWGTDWFSSYGYPA